MAVVGLSCDSGKSEAAHAADGVTHEKAESSIVTLTEEQIKTAGITIGPIERKDLGTTMKVAGRLEVPAQNKALVTSLYGGVLRTLNVHPGQHVRRGQVLGTVVNTELSGIQQQLISVNAQLRLAELEYSRQDELVKGNAAPLKNLQRAQADLSSLRAQHSALQKQLSALGISASHVSAGNISTTLSVTAPISGSISDITAQIGSNVDPSTSIATIVNNSQLHLDLFVYEKDLPHVRMGQTIHFTLTNAPGREYDARIFSIGTAFADETHAVPVHAEVEGDKTGLIDGMSVTAVISLGSMLAPAVPNEAIVRNGGKDYIFIPTDKKAGEHGHSHSEEGPDHQPTVSFEKIEVVRGASGLGFTIIQPIVELTAGTKVVTTGAFFLMAKMTNTGEHEH